jgi:hypothetical protein
MSEEREQLMTSPPNASWFGGSFAIRRLRASDAVLLWANARDSALPFYEKFGFLTVPSSEFAAPQSSRPHHLIELNLT